MTLGEIEAKNANNETAYDLAVKFDACYHEHERRTEHGLNPNHDQPEGEPYPYVVSDVFRSFWEAGLRCHAFRDIHVYFETGLNIVKWDIPQDVLDKIHELASELWCHYLKHWLEKLSVYQAARHGS
jgi:hypothetical protein